MDGWMYACVRVCVCVCMYVLECVCVCTYIHMCVCMYVYLHARFLPTIRMPTKRKTKPIRKLEKNNKMLMPGTATARITMPIISRITAGSMNFGFSCKHISLTWSSWKSKETCKATAALPYVHHTATVIYHIAQVL